MFSNFVFVLLFLLVVIYLIGFMNTNEGFRSVDSNIYGNVNGDSTRNKILYLSPPNPNQPNIDYQDYLNEVSGYDAGTRGYDNPYYANNVASGLDTN